MERVHRLTATVLVIVLISVSIQVYAVEVKPPWASKGKYLIYRKNVHTVKYSSNVVYTGVYLDLLKGNCTETAKYEITVVEEYEFVLEKHVLNREGVCTPALKKYLSLVDIGSYKTVVENETYTILYFEWLFVFNGFKFENIKYGNVSIPWVNYTYIYISTEYSITNVTTSSVTRAKLGNISVTFYHTLEVKYNSVNGFMEKMEYIATILEKNKPVLAIVFDLSLIDSNIPFKGFSLTDINTLTTLITAFMIAGIAAAAMYMVRVRRA